MQVLQFAFDPPAQVLRGLPARLRKVGADAPEAIQQPAFVGLERRDSLPGVGDRLAFLAGTFEGKIDLDVVAGAPTTLRSAGAIDVFLARLTP